MTRSPAISVGPLGSPEGLATRTEHPPERLTLVGDVAGPCVPTEFPAHWKSSTILANYEGVASEIAQAHAPASKCGPHLVTEHPELGLPMVWTLANNHSADYGPTALLELRRSLEQRGDATVGAGFDVEDARKGLILTTRSGSRIGILAACERQYGGATRTDAGTAEVAPWLHRAIRDMRAETSFVIVSVHAGLETSPWPSPGQQDLYRSFIDSGADLVHGHHPHVPQGFEEYGNGHIYYGLGNFLVDAERWARKAMGLVSIAVHIEENPTDPKRFRVWHETLEQVVDKSGRRIVNTGTAFQDYISAIAQPMKDRELLEALNQEIAVRLFQDHYYTYTQTRPVRRVTSLKAAVSKAARIVHSRISRGRGPDLTLLHHAFSCPTHAEAIETATAVLSGRHPDVRSKMTRQLVDSWAQQVPRIS